MVPRSGLQHAAVTSYGYKLQGLRIQVRQIARERDKARLDLEKAERRCLQLGRELDEQYVALEHAQSKLKDVQGETEAKELLLQQSVNHQAKLEADTQFLKGIQASLQGRLNHTMKENTQLQNKVTEMAEKLVASEKLVLELQKELNRTVNDKLRQVEPHSPELLNQSECFAEIVLEYERQCQSETSKGEVSHLNVKMCQLGRVLTEHKAGHGAGHGTVQLRSQRLAEAEWLQGADTATRLEHHQQHAACWMEMELLRQQLKASQEKLLEAKASLSLAQTRHALQLQQAKAQMNNMVPKKQFEQLQISLREEQCKGQQLQENLHQQAEQTRKQLVRTQEEYERLLQAAVEQAEELEHNLRSAEAVLAERAAQLKDVQAQLFRNKLLIEDLREESREFAMALQAAELKQKSSEEKNQLLEKQASALKQLIGKITPASLSV
ncbi:ninein-like protein isoform X3 [Grus americana]|uniref:ninein-like protein isoform X3 n=1 Tax=Grus americana TaxID=9117 RepID=UPI0024079EF9|nr:ninein-like protein isoform X3 [Grus americana]